MENWYDNRIKSELNGTNPMVMKEMPGGFAVFGDVQFLPGTQFSCLRRMSHL